jgi:glycosyltransferase involved in cell wall biosynthesis
MSVTTAREIAKASSRPGRSVVARAPRPRLLFLVTLAETGGVASYSGALLPGLAEPFEVVVAAHGDGPLRDLAERLGMRYVQLQHLRRPIHPVHDVLAVPELLQLIRQHRPHIVHVHSSKAGIIGRFAACLARVPVRIFTVHGWSFAAYSPPASWLFGTADRAMCAGTSMIVCPAHAVRSAGLRAHTCRADRSIVIPNAVDVAAFRRAHHSPRTPRILTVGRLAFPKAFTVLLRAFAMVGPGRFRAAIAGDGPQRDELEGEIAALGLSDAVQLLGTRPDVGDLLAESDIFVLSSQSECLPMSVIEAMAAGLPVVASAVGGVPELVEHRRTGILVPPDDPAALADAIAQLGGDADLRRRMGEAGRARAEALFDLGGFRLAHFDMYARELACRRLPLPRPVEGAGMPSPLRAGVR